ncbi:MAG TPA: DUF3558 family protein [Pseudonocardiaceae bacterium]|nr:DUF3558 family protein [Pseudonocardiaceae bacterium]
MPHRVFVLPLILATAIGLSACSSPTSIPGKVTPKANPLASVDPCTLIAQADVTSSGLEAGQTVDAPGARECRWHRPDDGATIDGYVIQIAIYDTAGIDQLNTDGGTATDYSVGRYQGKLFQDTPLNACIASLPTSATSRVDIDVISTQGPAKACELVQEAAPHVVPRFPAT